MSLLVTGGAGYIGSHAVLALLDAGYEVTVLDDLSTGHRTAVPAAATFIQGDVGDRELLATLLRDQGITAVLHFAGSIVVPESVEKPLDYYRNNSFKSGRLIEACTEAGVDRFIFSSTAAVYGMPDRVPVSESDPTAPINPYGTTKLITEWMLRDTAAAHGLKYLALRYFNVAGADPAGRSGQSSRRATHLIKIAAEAVTGQRPHVAVFGEDYDTEDGTCVRDYIHVTDLAEAHVAALRHLEAGGDSDVLNCGYGRGYSVRQVLDTVERVGGRPLDIRSAPRRAGDAAKLVCDPSRLRSLLDWQPKHEDLDKIVASALAWERSLAAESAPARNVS